MHELFNFLWMQLDYIHILVNILVTLQFFTRFYRIYTGICALFIYYEYTHIGVAVLWNYTQLYTFICILTVGS